MAGTRRRTPNAGADIVRTRRNGSGRDAGANIPNFVVAVIPSWCFARKSPKYRSAAPSA
jgi:hypothetical protein